MGLFKSTIMLTPETDNCIVCDSTDHNDHNRIVVFEFAGYGVEVFTFPAKRVSVWKVEAEKLANRGGIPRYLCHFCHHGTPRPTPQMNVE